MAAAGRAMLCKVVVIGDSGVGKSNLISRFACDEFNVETQTTIGVEFMTKDTQVAGTTLKAQIWDTAGQERFRSIARTMYQGAKAVLLVYDLTKRASFDHLTFWLKELRAYVPANTVVMLVGNKCDLHDERAVPMATAQQFAEAEGLLFLETSALDCTNVTQAFEVMLQEVLDRMKTNPGPLPTEKTAPDAGSVVHVHSTPVLPNGVVTGKGPCACKV